MSTTIKELELQDKIFISIQKAFLYTRQFTKKEEEGRDAYAKDIQPILDLFLPLEQRGLINYDLKKTFNSQLATALADPRTKLEIEFLDQWLVEALKIKVKNSDWVELVATTILHMSMAYKRATGQHITNTYQDYQRIIYAMTNFSTEASSAHQYALETKIADIYNEKTAQLKNGKTKNEKKEAKNINEYNDLLR
jgi:hypothetical protein